MAVPQVRDRTAPGTSFAVTSPSSTIQGDLLIIFSCERTTTSPTHELINGFTLIGSTELDDAAEDARATIAYKVATVDGAASYTAVSSDIGTAPMAGMVVLKRDTYDLTSIVYGGQQTTTTGQPNPPLVVPLGEGLQVLALATGIWRSSAAEANTAGAPSGFGNVIQESGSTTIHLAVADLAFDALAISGVNPSTWTDTIAPTGSIGETVLIAAPTDLPSISEVTAPGTGLAASTTSGVLVGDLVVVITWERAGAGVPTHTIESGYTQVYSVSHDDGSTDGRLSAAYKIATSPGINSYQAFTSSSGTDCWTGLIVFSKDTFDPNVPFYGVSGTTSTGTGAPNPPAGNLVSEGGAGVSEPFTFDTVVLAISAWHLSAGATVTVTPPANYSTRWSVAGSQTSEFGLATRTMGKPTIAPDPGAWTDDVVPNGTASLTLCVKSLPPVTVPKAGMIVVIPA